MTSLLIVTLLLLASDPLIDDLPADVFARPPGTVDAAFARFLEIVAKDDHTSMAWQAESAAAETLVAFGPPAAFCLMRTAEHQEASREVRYSCYYIRTSAIGEAVRSSPKYGVHGRDAPRSTSWGMNKRHRSLASVGAAGDSSGCQDIWNQYALPEPTARERITPTLTFLVARARTSHHGGIRWVRG